MIKKVFCKRKAKFAREKRSLQEQSELCISTKKRERNEIENGNGIKRIKIYTHLHQTVIQSIALRQSRQYAQNRNACLDSHLRVQQD